MLDHHAHTKQQTSNSSSSSSRRRTFRRCRRIKPVQPPAPAAAAAPDGRRRDASPSGQQVWQLLPQALRGTLATRIRSDQQQQARYPQEPEQEAGERAPGVDGRPDDDGEHQQRRPDQRQEAGGALVAGNRTRNLERLLLSCTAAIDCCWICFACLGYAAGCLGSERRGPPSFL
jgi:hypothetical protein